MKKSKLILVAFMGVVIAMMSIVIDVLDKDQVIPADQLPLAAKSGALMVMVPQSCTWVRWQL